MVFAPLTRRKHSPRRDAMSGARGSAPRLSSFIFFYPWLVFIPFRESNSHQGHRHRREHLFSPAFELRFTPGKGADQRPGINQCCHFRPRRMERRTAALVGAGGAESTEPKNSASGETAEFRVAPTSRRMASRTKSLALRPCRAAASKRRLLSSAGRRTESVAVILCL